MSEILIPENLQKKARRGRSHQDAYLIDVYLKDGRIFRNLAAREGVCITGKASAADLTSNLPFTSIHIADVEPYYPVLYNFTTLVFWALGCLFRFYKPSQWVRFSEISWAPSRLFRKPYL